MQVLGKLNAGLSESGKFLRDCLDHLADVFTCFTERVLTPTPPECGHPHQTKEVHTDLVMDQS